MTHTILDFRLPNPADAPLEYTGHEALTEQFRAALKGDGPDQHTEQTAVQTEDQAK